MSEHDKDFKTVVRMKLANLQRVVSTVFEEKVQPMLRKLSVRCGALEIVVGIL